MCSCRTYVPVIACLSIPGFELKAALRKAPSLDAAPGGALAGARWRAVARPGDRRGRGSGHPAADASRRGACDLPAARARRAGSCGSGAGVGGDRPLARGRRLRGRVGRARDRVLRDAWGGAPLRRPRRGASACARRGRHCMGCAHRRSRPAVRRARGRVGRTRRAAARRARRGGGAVPRAAAAHAPAARAAALRRAGVARRAKAWTACRAPGWRRRRTIGAGRPARLGPGEGRGGRAGARSPSAGRGSRDARVP